MWSYDLSQRPPWLGALIGLGVGAAGQLLISVAMVSGAGWSGPVVTILAPAVVGLIAALIVRGGWGLPGVAVGMIVVSQLLPSLAPDLEVVATIDLVVALASAMLGYGTGFAIVQQSNPFEFRPPQSADLARAESEARAQLRGIDPQAPGAFERATVLLRAVNEQVSSASMWAGPRPTGETASAPTGLLDLQAELVETARIAAIASGARRVTITSSGMGGGIDVQAVFGDPIGPGERLPPAVSEPTPFDESPTTVSDVDWTEPTT